LVTIGNWLTKLDASYEASLTYEFFLPQKEHQRYFDAINEIAETDPKAVDKAWKLIKHDFIRFYTYKIWGGDIINQNTADSDSLQKFDFQFLNAIRDVERDMLTGRNTLLRDVLDFFLDYSIKNDGSLTEEEQKQEIKRNREDFSEEAQNLLLKLDVRMEHGKSQILSYAKDTGASFNNANPDFDGSLSESELFSALRLIVKYETGIEIKVPATHNGLGYNNLIFMSLLLAKMQVNSDGNYLGSNAKVFATLAIEEPEAHLHPSMQYKFLKFLKENKQNKKVRQIFVTTHSTHITSAVSLDEIICLHNEKGETTIGYPGKVFPTEPSKKYAQRFLDATKSDMLFAQKVILVEGIAEQLLMSILAQYIDKSLEDNHIAVINVGGRYFNHFLHLFDSQKDYTIHKKIVCLTDRDPERKEKKPSKSFKKCYPFEYNQDATLFEYQDNPTTLIDTYKSHPNIRFFSQDADKGKTFEYDLVLHNPTMDILLTESMKNTSEIQELMSFFTNGKPILDYETKLRSSDENKKISDGITANTSWNEEDKKKAIIAARYLNSVGKGENALELAYVLEENLSKKGGPDYKTFVVPKYIEDAITWICQ
jgi:putative ATP-dependent endonuclease of the OLD family